MLGLHIQSLEQTPACIKFLRIAGVAALISNKRPPSNSLFTALYKFSSLHYITEYRLTKAKSTSIFIVMFE